MKSFAAIFFGHFSNSPPPPQSEIWIDAAAYDAKINVGCLSLVSEMNGGNIRLRMMLK